MSCTYFYPISMSFNFQKELEHLMRGVNHELEKLPVIVDSLPMVKLRKELRDAMELYTQGIIMSET